MGRKSSVEQIDPGVRAHIERRLRENRLTLDGLIADLQEHFPGEIKPSRSALGRYRQNFDEMMQRTREQQEMARLLVEELGENPDDRAGALMMQSITTLVNHAAMNLQEADDVAIEDVRKLARAANDAMRGRKISMEERKAIRAAARDELLKEQEARLEEARGSDGMSEQFEERIRRILVGKA